MYIDKGVMEEYLSDEKKFDALCKQKEEINARFGFVKIALKEIKEVRKEITEDSSFKKVEWNNNKASFLEGEVSRSIFAPSKINLTVDAMYFGVERQAMYFCQCYRKKDFQNKIINFLSVIGGFQDGKAKDWYRILSNAKTQQGDFYKELKSLKSNGQYAWINSNFADNTLFIEFVDFMDSQKYDYIALCYPINKKNKGKIGEKPIKNLDDVLSLQKESEAQNKKMPYRFPLKFLWMWANKDNVIHPLSLMAFVEFLKSEFMSKIFEILSQEDGEQCFSEFNYDDDKKMGTDFSKYAEQITNAKIEYFPEIWKKVSGAIMNKLKDVAVGEEQTTEKVSQLISFLTLGETDMTNIDELLKTHKQIILYGVPGTGKTHSAKELIRKWSKEEFQNTQEESKKEDDLKEWQFGEIAKERKGGDCIGLDREICKKIAEAPIVWDIMQFHPNTTYQDFIGGIIPKTGVDGSLTYGVENGKFKEFCEYASANSTTPFVFIIDEINRANLSEVLGELLYALEYRDEGITIPNFNEPFVIPSNVYIIGTMNNVDKSLSTFDLALRRRFGFYEVGVDCDVIGEILKSKEIGNLDVYVERCQDLNALVSGEIEEEDRERLKNEEKLNLEKHYKIGQAYFAKIEKFLQKGEAINPNHLRKLWDYHLQPLIEEYIGFSMNDKEISNKLKRLKDFWTKKLPEESE